MVSNLAYVTLTGADDSVSPENLVQLSNKYPFVEWGILIGSRNGVPRFPSLEWIEKLAKIDTKINLSLHVCGSYLDEILNNCELLFPVNIFSRIQLNFHGISIPKKSSLNILKICELHTNKTFIVQLDGINDWVLSLLLNNNISATGLYDYSHGAGIRPRSWIENSWSFNDIQCIGYAGGIGPESVITDTKNIEKCAKGKFWIDMETKLRSINNGDIFDCAKCEYVLKAINEM